MRIVTAALASIMMMAPGVALAQDGVRRRAQAAQQGLALLESTSPTFIQKGGAIRVTTRSFRRAQASRRERGIQTGATIAQLNDELSDATTERFIEYAQGGGADQRSGYELFARMAAKQPADERVYAQLYFCDRCSVDGKLASRQSTSSHLRRRHDDRADSQCADRLHASGTCVRYQAACRAGADMASADQSAEHTGACLQTHGTCLVEGDRAALDLAAADLRSQQRSDGGWSQHAAMPTDAYATGMALYAMYQGVLADGRGVSGRASLSAPDAGSRWNLA